MIIRGLLAGLIGLGAVLTADTSHAAERWTCNIFGGPKHFIQKVLRDWSKNVKQATSGEVDIRFLPSNAAPPPKQLDGIIAGTYDCAFIFHAFTTRKAIGPQFGILPFIGPADASKGSIAFQRTWKKHFAAKKEFADDGLHVLTMFQFSGVQIYTARSKPIDSVEDLKSQKVWALAGTSSQTMKSLGVSHVSGPAARLAEFTQTKVVQGLVGASPYIVAAFAGMQFPRYGTNTSKSLMLPSFGLKVGSKKWDALSGETKRQVMSASGEKLAAVIGQASESAEGVVRTKLAAAGVKHISASKEFEASLVKAARPQIEAWVQQVKGIGVDGNQVIKDYIRIVNELGS